MASNVIPTTPPPVAHQRQAGRRTATARSTPTPAPPARRPPTGPRGTCRRAASRGCRTRSSARRRRARRRARGPGPAAAARCSSSVTSSSSTGAGCGSRPTIRLVMPSARPKFEISTVAPCSWATRATAKPIELSIVTPATRIRLPSRMPMPVVLLRRLVVSDGCRRSRSVAHAEAAVDRDHRPGDVRRLVRAEPPHHARRPPRLVAKRSERDLRLVLRLLSPRGARRSSRSPRSPGATTLAVIDRLPSSRASDRAMPTRPGLAGGVVDLAGRAEQADHRGDEDQPAAAQPQHALGGPLGDPEGAGQVGVDDACTSRPRSSAAAGCPR